MGARGPQPLPTAIKKARGTYRADRAAPGEVTAPGRPTCPTWVKNKFIRKSFTKTVKMLEEAGVVGEIDSNIIARYCTNLFRWERAMAVLVESQDAEIQSVGRDEQGRPKQQQQSTLNSIVRDLDGQLHRAEQALGMNPSARSRISGTDRGGATPGIALPEP